MTVEALVLNNAPVVTFGYVMQVIVSLFVVLAFIYAAGKYLLPRIKPSGSSKLIKVLDRVTLEPQVSAYILKVGRSAWLVVAGNKSVTKIEKIEESDLS